MEPAHTESVIATLPAPRRKRDCEPKYRVSAFKAVASERLCDAIARHISTMTTRQATVAIGDGHTNRSLTSITYHVADGEVSRNKVNIV